MSDVHTASCLCRKVLIVTTGPLRGVVYCHCSQCRKQTGHHFAATNVADENLSVEGAEHVTWYAASDFAKRGFCRHCGSALFWKPNDGNYTSVMAGAFDKPSGLHGESHIFVTDKGDYYAITDGLPQFERAAPGIIVAEEVTVTVTRTEQGGS